VRRPIAAALLAVAIALGAGGCGGGDDEPATVTKDLYIARADQVCAGLASDISGAGAATPKTPQDITESAKVLAGAYGDLLKKLRDLKPPAAAADRRGAAAYVAAVARTDSHLVALRSAAEALQDAVDSKDKQRITNAGTAVQRALADFRSSQAQANQRALAYGFEVCPSISGSAVGPGQQVDAVADGLADDAHPRHPPLELARRVAVHIGAGAHLLGVPEAAGLVDALQPRHAPEGLGHEHDDVLLPALALHPGAADVRDAGAAEQRALQRPAAAHAVDVALELTAVEGVAGGRHRAWVSRRTRRRCAARRRRWRACPRPRPRPR
jgi:hypothetical protein